MQIAAKKRSQFVEQLLRGNYLLQPTRKATNRIAPFRKNKACSNGKT
jgi:phage gp16-like protein